MTVGHKLIHETGTCNAYCKDWRVFQPIEKNWENFKRFFSKANRDLYEYQVISETHITAIGCQANAVNQELDQVLDHEASALDVIANVVVENSEGKNTISTITTRNSSLVQDLFTLRKELAAFKKGDETKSGIIAGIVALTETTIARIETLRKVVINLKRPSARR